MRVRLLLAAGVLSFVPAFARAQDVPAAAPVQVSPAPIAAHRGGSVEVSLSGGFSLIDKAFNDFLSLDTVRIANQDPGAVMMGGQLRVTWNFSPHLGLGLGAGVTNGNGAILMAPFGALTYTFDLNRKFSPFIDLGAGITRVAAYTGQLLGDPNQRVTSSYSAFGGLGVRAMLSAHLALRVEGRMSYDKFSSYALNSAGFVGLSLFVGGGPPRDADGDGVPDKRDACADTPAGATVDTQGCALDSDRDGVYDGLDQCADTPAGATVDAQGCALDSDRDGVYDGLDRCPDTPAGATVDANGCPVDSDADGVVDNLDRCANTPADARPVDANGCPVDSDNDAVADYLDRCANTAAGTRVDTSGCPVARDADGDGVIDANDRCANTPPNTRVDATGCPLPEPVAVAPAPAAGAPFVLRSITFRTFQARMAVAPNAELDGIAASLRSMPDARWEIAGYTDSRGIPAGNQRLSQRRAAAVIQYLIGKGVPSTSLTAVGYGAQNPVASNATLAGRAQNRRIEIKRLP